ncbi:hypothetical protein [Paraburkholderia sp. BL10I2N1]|uniref:hypothetical protein n=1 Tax=Paraburkholderia sp. BL10I2N1 TaxID=1938796 RepID=UPI00105FFF8C|nr:hypothetical protein [Paraburkholderia sp. BL10I2N1]TDN58899.1 hypothetical protein B0G77_8072 [Paraburkholderia sp. BL10I2N1]
MPDEIVRYAKNVFTNDGQSTVDEFKPKLDKVKSDIQGAGAITVYYGFHGDPNGEFDRAFDAAELQKSKSIANDYPDANMVQVSGPADPQIDYATHNKDGQVLFTWCDSDKYIKTKKLMPNIVK